MLVLATSREPQVRFYAKALVDARAAYSAGSFENASRILQEANARLRTVVTRTEPPQDTIGRVGIRRVFSGLTIAFIVIITLAFWILSESLYTAPFAFYALVAAAGGILAWNAYVCGEQRPVGVLVQVFLLGILLKFYYFYLNPYVYASDAFFQYGGIVGLSATGSVPPILGHYSYFPGFIVLGYEGATLLGLPDWLFGVITLVAPLISLPAAYLIGREIADRRTGLFASLLMAFSVFGFLSTHYNPSLTGLPFLLLSLYAVIRLKSAGDARWLLIFWVAALGAFFSHPINALILALILLLRFAYFGLSRHPSSTQRVVNVPALSYTIVYGAYLIFIALTSFELFVRTFLTPTYAPPLATAPTEALQKTSMYVLESAIAPLGVAVAFFLVGYGLLETGRISRVEQQYFVLLAIAFVILPVFDIVGQNFRSQSSRFLVYFSIPIAFLGAGGIVGIARLFRNRRRAAAFILVLFVSLGFLASSTYLTSNDTRFLYSDVPASTTHITQSALASRTFLALAIPGASVYMDAGSLRYFEDTNRAPDPLTGLDAFALNELLGPRGNTYVLLNDHFIAYGDPSKGTFFNIDRINTLLDQSHASLVFDAGAVQVFLLPPVT